MRRAIIHAVDDADDDDTFDIFMNRPSVATSAHDTLDVAEVDTEDADADQFVQPTRASLELEVADSRRNSARPRGDDDAKAKHDSPARKRSISGSGDDAA